MTSHNTSIPDTFNRVDGYGRTVDSVQAITISSGKKFDRLITGLNYLEEMCMDCAFDVTSAPTLGDLWLYKLTVAMNITADVPFQRFAPIKVLGFQDILDASSIKVLPGFSKGFVNGLEGYGFHSTLDTDIVKLNLIIRRVPKPVILTERR